MTIAFISDIHGNYEALKSVLSEIDKEGITQIYCAGDVVGYYSQVNECCDALRDRQIPTVMGNHDWYMVGGGFCPRSRSVNDCLAYQRTVIRPDHIAWLRSFPVQMFIDDIHMVHGGWADPIDEYLEPTQDYFDRVIGEKFVSGHNHIQVVHQFGSKLYCNPGSVGMPRDGDPRAAWAIYDGTSFHLRRVEYDIEKVFELMARAGFSDYYYGGLKTGARNLQRPPQ